MKIVKKDAQVANTDETFPGSFQVILSAPTKDRDGDTLLPEDWKQPLPAHITFDMDHGMTVASTVGSGVPSINGAGQLVVDGTYSSLPRAQEVRSLVNEGHIKTTSVAFMSEPAETKDGKKRTVRELLNGAFVAIPSNREALVLASKSYSLTGATDSMTAALNGKGELVIKAGARNSKSDAAMIQQIHDHAVALGASPDVAKSLVRKAGDTPQDDDPAALALAVDAALDQFQVLLADVDASTLPEPVQQALGLITAAEEAVDALLEALNTPDPDDVVDSAGATTLSAPGAPGAGKAATPADEDEKFRLAAHVRAMTTLALNPEGV